MTEKSTKTKLTLEDIEKLVDYPQYQTIGTLTICILTLTNGAQVTGQSNVISPENFDQQIGRDVSYRNAVDKLWELEGYACKTRGFV